MRPIKITVENNDAAGFVSQVEQIINGLAVIHRPQQFIVLKVKDWFGSKWLGFSGKVMGAFGVHMDELTVPPFVPNRILTQRRFVAENYDEVDGGEPIHLEMSGEHATRRKIKDVVSNTILVWFSSDSDVTKHGAILVYASETTRFKPWYCAWGGSESWHIAQVKNIGKNEVLFCLEQGAKSTDAHKAQFSC